MTDVTSPHPEQVRGMTQDSRTLVRLFERCGERDLRFVVRSGLVLGGMLGVLQMLLWRVWSPWWSLALTGGLVGYVTDLLAIRMLFEPVDPVRMTLTLTVTLTLTLILTLSRSATRRAASSASRPSRSESRCPCTRRASPSSGTSSG